MAQRTKTPKQPTGYILYRGPSLLNGAPIVVVALVGSSNRKTGNMVQTYILSDGPDRPTVALKTGADEAICGDCKHRPTLGGSCYVVVAQGPTVVWKGVQAGRYPMAQDWDHVVALGAGRMVRLGTYGDPAAVPVTVWQHLTAQAQGRTGYTHQWATLPTHRATVLRSLVMASADSEAERAQAVAQGWRTFRVRTEAQPVTRGEFVCPASEEAGKRTTCAQCGACDGAERGANKASPVIIAHGAKARRFIAINPA